MKSYTSAAFLLVTATNVWSAQVEYGERLKVVGNQAALGSWDVSKAVELKWHDGDLWAGEVEMPVGKDIEFKVSSFQKAKAFCILQISWCRAAAPHRAELHTQSVTEFSGIVHVLGETAWAVGESGMKSTYGLAT
jgi:hypothetical protein